MLDEGYLYLYIDSDFDCYEYDLKNKNYKKVKFNDVDNDNYEKIHRGIIPFENGYYTIYEENKRISGGVGEDWETHTYISYVKKSVEIEKYEVEYDSQIIAVNNNGIVFLSTYFNDEIGIKKIYFINKENGAIKEICRFYSDNPYFANNKYLCYNSSNKIYMIDLSKTDLKSEFLFEGKIQYTLKGSLIYEDNKKYYKYDFQTKTSKKVSKLFFPYKNSGAFIQDDFYVNSVKYTPVFYKFAIFSPVEEEPEESFQIILFSELFIKKNDHFMRIKVNSQSLNSCYANCYGYSQDSVI